jgi:NAD(P)-dependent dehydrogenase (short-subunit alcohol dehydrogenase family)
LKAFKQVLITGANRGIGLEHVRFFASRGVNVFAAVRNPQEAHELTALQSTLAGVIKIFPYDAISNQSNITLKNLIGNVPIDLLLANAGDFGTNTALANMNTDDFFTQVQVNALAPLRLAEALVDNVALSDAKIIAFQSSIMGSTTLNEGGGFYSYRASKAMLNIFVKNLSIDLKPRNITVVALHPGWVKTRMGGPDAALSVVDSVAGQQIIFETINLESTGTFINHDGQQLEW